MAADIQEFLDQKRARDFQHTPGTELSSGLPWRTRAEIAERESEKADEGIFGIPERKPISSPEVPPIKAAESEKKDDLEKIVELVESKGSAIKKACKVVEIFARAFTNERNNPQMAVNISNSAQKWEKLLRSFLKSAEEIAPSYLNYIGKAQHPNGMIQNLIEEYLEPTINALIQISFMKKQADIFAQQIKLSSDTHNQVVQLPIINSADASY